MNKPTPLLVPALDAAGAVGGVASIKAYSAVDITSGADDVASVAYLRK